MKWLIVGSGQIAVKDKSFVLIIASSFCQLPTAYCLLITALRKELGVIPVVCRKALVKWLGLR